MTDLWAVLDDLKTVEMQPRGNPIAVTLRKVMMKIEWEKYPDGSKGPNAAVFVNGERVGSIHDTKEFPSGKRYFTICKGINCLHPDYKHLGSRATITGVEKLARRLF